MTLDINGKPIQTHGLTSYQIWNSFLMQDKKEKISDQCSRSIFQELCCTLKKTVNFLFQLHLFQWLSHCAEFWKLFYVMSSVTFNSLLYLLSFGVVEVLWHKRITMITEKSFQTGGNQSGRLLLSSHQRVQSSIIMFTIQEMKTVVSNHASLSNGQTLWNKLISIQQEVMLWVTLLSQQKKH